MTTAKDRRNSTPYHVGTLRVSWVLLVNQGGWWASAEIRDELAKHPELEFEPFKPECVSNSLAYAATRNLLTRRETFNGRFEYAVMPDNCVPKDTPIKHILR